jgi:hypothetical protein
MFYVCTCVGNYWFGSRVLDNLNGDYYGVDDRLICILGTILLCLGVVCYM